MADPYGPFVLNGGDMACRSASGDEIKATQLYEAPQDCYFTAFGTSVDSGVSYVGAPERPVTGIEKKKVRLKLDNGLDVEVEVPFRYQVMAHADCGSGEARTAVHLAKGEHIFIRCNVSGQTAKYMK